MCVCVCVCVCVCESVCVGVGGGGWRYRGREEDGALNTFYLRLYFVTKFKKVIRSDPISR